MVSKGSIIAFDFGMSSIGVAIGQRITCTAWPLKIFKARNGIPNWLQIEKLLKEWCPEIVVVGLPLNMDGSEQPITALARKFAKKLNSSHFFINMQLILHDERLSTFEARTELFQRNGYRALKKRKVDAESAMVILESWLEQFPE